MNRALAPGAARVQSAPRAQRHFTVLDRRALAARRKSRQARALLGLAGLALAGALGVVAASQSLVASEQVRLDNARQSLASAVQAEQQLQSTRARLAAPARVLAVAEKGLHMVAPAQVTYLTPVAKGPTLGSTSAPAVSGPTATITLAAPRRPHGATAAR